MKVILNGETFDYDGRKAPMSEALAVERVYKRKYAQWQEDLAAGGAEAMCVLAWIIWRRDGRNVPYEDIIDGKADFDLLEMLTSLAESAQAEADAAEEKPDPTGQSALAGTHTTGTATRGSSRSTSGSARGR